MGRIRSFVEDDIPRIVDLYRIVFARGGPVDSDRLASFLRHVFFESPWLDDELRSLVAENGSSEIVGFLGVFPRPMELGGRKLRVAVSNLFMVDPHNRSALTGLQLLQHFFRGPQDLSLAEGGDISRKLWESLGGRTSLLYSLNWARPLRPGLYAASMLPATSGMRRFAPLYRPMCRMADAAAARMHPNRFSREDPGLVEQELGVDEHLAVLAEIPKKRTIRPVYDERSLDWLLQVFARKTTYGHLHRVLVRASGGEVAGWYLYYSKPGEVSKVMQIAAVPGKIREVLHSLFRHAWKRGAIAVSGGVDPMFLQDLSDEYCFCAQGETWLMVQARDAELLGPFERGDAFFTRLEGEWMFYNPGLASGY